MKRVVTRRQILWSALTLTLVGGGCAALMHQAIPSDLDLSLSRPGEKGLYQLSIEPGISPVTVGTLHGWIITVKDQSGRPVEGADFTIEGGMPQHGHGLPTMPQVTRRLGEGRYYLYGVKFTMSGWWVLDLSVKASSGTDRVAFNIML